MSEASHAAPGSRHPLLIAVIVATAFFMESLDGTVIATALPKMAGSFGRSPVDLSIGLTAYMLTVAVFIPASGWLADRFGTRRVFAGAIAVFTLASVWCGVSRGLGEFTLARILQGMAGALMSPVGRLVVLRMTARADLVRAITFTTVPGLIGPMLGPPVGGFIATYASWRWIFFLNVPIGLVGIVLVLVFIDNLRSAERRPFDRTGFLLNGSAVACLMYGLDRLGDRGGQWAEGTALCALGAVAGWLAVRHARQAPHPLVEVTAMRVPTYAVTTWAGLLFRTAIFAPSLLLPLLLQIGLGMTAFMSGLMILAHAAGDILAKTVTTRLLRRFGYRSSMIWSAAAFALLVGACGFFTAGTPRIVILAILGLSGAARSMQMTGLGTLQFADIPPDEMTAASTLSSVAQQVTRGVGVAFAALLLNLALTVRSGPDGTLGLADFRVAFLATAVLALSAVAWYVPLAHGTGAALSGHRLQTARRAP